MASRILSRQWRPSLRIPVPSLRTSLSIKYGQKLPKESSWLRPYLSALDTISARTKTPVSSLIVSFALLHELTAIIPVIGFFFAAKYAGVGELLVESVRGSPSGKDEDGEGPIPPLTNTGQSSVAATVTPQSGWWRSRISEYLDEGEKWASRVGRRYGWWGYQKGASLDSVEKTDLEKHLVGDVANAVVAYAVTKALLPLRIGLALYIAPSFSRALIQPTWNLLGRFIPRLRNRTRPSARGSPPSESTPPRSQ